MDDKKTNMTFDDAEKDFKKKVFDIFSEIKAIVELFCSI